MEQPIDPAVKFPGANISGVRSSEQEQTVQIQNLERLLVAERQLTATLKESLAALMKENSTLKEKLEGATLSERFDASDIIRPTPPSPLRLSQILRQLQSPPPAPRYKSAISNFQEHYGASRYIPGSADGDMKRKQSPEALKHFTPPSHAGPANASRLDNTESQNTPTPTAPVYFKVEPEEAKRGRRRESRSIVERLRRDHINQKIQEMVHLIPHHRLHKHNPSESISNTISESSTPDLNLEKEPNKGEILAEAVDWIRDLMWMTDSLLQGQEQGSRSLGYDLLDEIVQTEDEKKMLDELREAIMVTDAQDFRYSRTNESNTTWEIISPSPTSSPMKHGQISRDGTKSFQNIGARGAGKIDPDGQTQWVCMLGDPALQTEDGWVCALCNYSHSSRPEMVTHLIKEHRINNCTMKPLGSRNWTTKDRLKEHLQQIHSLSPDCDYWQYWHRPSSGNLTS